MTLMQNCNKLTWFTFQQFSCLVLLCIFFAPLVSADSKSSANSNIVQPVINAGNKQTSISRNGLSAIFKMRLRQWSDGSPVTVFVLPDDNPLHKQFSKQVLNVFSHQLRRIWNKAVFSGSGQAPITLESVEEMVEHISNTPGSIGYLKTDTLNEHIKVLNIR